MKNKGNVTSSGWRKMLLIFSGLQTLEECSNFHLLLRQVSTRLLIASKWKDSFGPQRESVSPAKILRGQSVVHRPHQLALNCQATEPQKLDRAVIDPYHFISSEQIDATSKNGQIGSNVRIIE